MSKLLFIIFMIAAMSQLVIAQDAHALKAEADSGNTEAMMKLSELYMFGKGVSANEDSADYWVNRAAAAGHPGAEYLLGVRFTGKLYDLKKFAVGMDWLQKAAEHGQVDAMIRLMEIWSDPGTGLQKESGTSKYYSLKKAYEYAVLAARKGSDRAALYAANALLEGKGVSRNDSLGLAYLQLAAGKGLPDAQILLGDIYLAGKITGGVRVFDAYEQYFKAYHSRRSTIDHKTLADIGMHYTDQYLKKIHNTMVNAAFFLPPDVYEYKLRE